MKIIEKVEEMQRASLELKRKGVRMALVPTMGFLHEGHLRLVDEAKKHADYMVMSIFVNPTQFGPGEDFESYPRDLERDKKLAEGRGVQILFSPPADEVYSAGDQTTVVVTELTRGLCGPFRPGHFRGVTTVVAKLLMMVGPEVTVFGEKDYQQLKVIQRMVQDLKIPTKIIGVETLREEGGLALSSRNTYLSASEKEEALNLYRSIQRAQERVRSGERRVSNLLQEVRNILSQGKLTELEYAQVVDAETLEPLEKIEGPARLVMAARVNGKRLIDNGPLIP